MLCFSSFLLRATIQLGGGYSKDILSGQVQMPKGVGLIGGTRPSLISESTEDRFQNSWGYELIYTSYSDTVFTKKKTRPTFSIDIRTYFWHLPVDIVGVRCFFSWTTCGFFERYSQPGAVVAVEDMMLTSPSRSEHELSMSHFELSHESSLRQDLDTAESIAGMNGTELEVRRLHG